MEPTTENGGYERMGTTLGRSSVRFNGSPAPERWLCDAIFRQRDALTTLQWVHRPRTVVMEETDCCRESRQGASMGPPSENGGYELTSCASLFIQVEASMGPPSENGGYGHEQSRQGERWTRFNGGTVPERGF